MSLVTWRRYLFQNFKTHAVPSMLEPQLAAEMTARGARLSDYAAQGLENPKTIIGWGIDFGGMAHLHRPFEDFEWAGLALAIPSGDVAMVLRSLAELEPRRFIDGTAYFKLTVWMHCTVMTPEQHADLLALVEAVRDRAEERAALFQASLDRADLGN